MRVRDRAKLDAIQTRRRNALLWVCVVLVVLASVMVWATTRTERLDYAASAGVETPRGMRFNLSAPLDTSRIIDLRGEDCRKHLCVPGNDQRADPGCYVGGDLFLPWADLIDPMDPRTCEVFGTYGVPGGALTVFADGSAVYVPSGRH